MTEQQFNAIFDREAVERRGEKVFPLSRVRDAFGDDFAAFADMAFGDVMNRESPYHVARPCLLKIFRSFSEEKPTADQQAETANQIPAGSVKAERGKTMNEIDTVIQFMFDTDSKPNFDIPYDPLARLIDADDANTAAVYELSGKVSPEMIDRINDTCAAYGAASAIEAFDRGFRAGARMILQLLQTGAQPIPTV